MKCPHCSNEIDVRFIKAPPMQADQARKEASAPASTGDLGELLEAIDDNMLSGAAVAFVADMRDRYGKYKDRTKCSEKQLAWLKKLAYPEGDEF